MRGKKKIVLELLQHKADPNRLDRCDKTPLYYAIKGDFPEIVKELIVAGARVKEDNIDYISLMQQNPRIREILDVARFTLSKIRVVMGLREAYRKRPIILMNKLKRL